MDTDDVLWQDADPVVEQLDVRESARVVKSKGWEKNGEAKPALAAATSTIKRSIVCFMSGNSGSLPAKPSYTRLSEVTTIAPGPISAQKQLSPARKR